MIEATEDFWQGYACAMEEIEFKLKKLSPAPSDTLLAWIREEIAGADKKIAELRQIEGR